MLHGWANPENELTLLKARYWPQSIPQSIPCFASLPGSSTSSLNWLHSSCSNIPSGYGCYIAMAFRRHRNRWFIDDFPSDINLHLLGFSMANRWRTVSHNQRLLCCRCSPCWWWHPWNYRCWCRRHGNGNGVVGPVFLQGVWGSSRTLGMDCMNLCYVMWLLMVVIYLYIMYHKFTSNSPIALRKGKEPCASHVLIVMIANKDAWSSVPGWQTSFERSSQCSKYGY